VATSGGTEAALDMKLDTNNQQLSNETGLGSGV